MWDALTNTPAEAVEMKMRSAVMMAVEEAVRAWGTTQAVAAKRLKISQPRLNDLLRGKISKFSLEALVGLAVHAGLKVTVKITQKAA